MKLKFFNRKNKSETSKKLESSNVNKKNPLRNLKRASFLSPKKFFKNDAKLNKIQKFIPTKKIKKILPTLIPYKAAIPRHAIDKLDIELRTFGVSTIGKSNVKAFFYSHKFSLMIISSLFILIIGFVVGLIAFSKLFQFNYLINQFENIYNTTNTSSNGDYKFDPGYSQDMQNFKGYSLSVSKFFSNVNPNNDIKEKSNSYIANSLNGVAGPHESKYSVDYSTSIISISERVFSLFPDFIKKFQNTYKLLQNQKHFAKNYKGYKLLVGGNVDNIKPADQESYNEYFNYSYYSPQPTPTPPTPPNPKNTKILPSNVNLNNGFIKGSEGIISNFLDSKTNILSRAKWNSSFPDFAGKEMAKPGTYANNLNGQTPFELNWPTTPPMDKTQEEKNLCAGLYFPLLSSFGHNYTASLLMFFIDQLSEETDTPTQKAVVPPFAGYDSMPFYNAIHSKKMTKNILIWLLYDHIILNTVIALYRAAVLSPLWFANNYSNSAFSTNRNSEYLEPYAIALNLAVSHGVDILLISQMLDGFTYIMFKQAIGLFRNKSKDSTKYKWSYFNSAFKSFQFYFNDFINIPKSTSGLMTNIDNIGLHYITMYCSYDLDKELATALPANPPHGDSNYINMLDDQKNDPNGHAILNTTFKKNTFWTNTENMREYFQQLLWEYYPDAKPASSPNNNDAAYYDKYCIFKQKENTEFAINDFSDYFAAFITVSHWK